MLKTISKNGSSKYKKAHFNIGILITISLLSAPNGFGGLNIAYRWAVIFGILSIIIILLNIKFIIKVEYIINNKMLSLYTTVFSLSVVFIIFFMLLFDLIISIVISILLSITIWLILGGYKLIIKNKNHV